MGQICHVFSNMIRHSLSLDCLLDGPRGTHSLYTAYRLPACATRSHSSYRLQAQLSRSYCFLTLAPLLASPPLSQPSSSSVDSSLPLAATWPQLVAAVGLPAAAALRLP